MEFVIGCVSSRTERGSTDFTSISTALTLFGPVQRMTNDSAFTKLMVTRTSRIGAAMISYWFSLHGYILQMSLSDIHGERANVMVVLKISNNTKLRKHPNLPASSSPKPPAPKSIPALSCGKPSPGSTKPSCRQQSQSARPPLRCWSKKSRSCRRTLLRQPSSCLWFVLYLMQLPDPKTQRTIFGVVSPL